MNKRNMNTVFKVLVALVLGAFGVGWSFYSLVRLGWLRHGRRIWNADFLHLDWILQPDLPYWGAHMGNLLHLAIGVACILGALYRLYRAAHEWRAARQTTREPGIPETHEDAPEAP
jgi:hypothetical protein